MNARPLKIFLRRQPDKLRHLAGKWQVFAAGASGFWNHLRLTPNSWQLRHAESRDQLRRGRGFEWKNTDYGNFKA
jgi:hypothetical protein